MLNAVVLATEKAAEVAEKTAETVTATKEISNLFACGMGIGVVFFGLICLVIVCLILGALFKGKGEKNESAPVPAAPVKTADNGVIENKQEIIAAVSAALAEELGSDVSAIKILSFKKM